jgi:predicted lipoprotein with Yx(FWY)xxD motif
MRRAAPLLLAGALASAACATTLASAQQAPQTARAGRAAVVTVRHTRLGQILSTSSGFTLYEFTRDRANRNSCVSISGCSETWPPLQTSGRPSAGAGVKASLLSTIRLSTGVTQVTYGGHPLYMYSGDSGPGDTSYVGARAFGGTWYALNAAGQAVR